MNVSSDFGKSSCCPHSPSVYTKANLAISAFYYDWLLPMWMVPTCPRANRMVNVIHPSVALFSPWRRRDRHPKTIHISCESCHCGWKRPCHNVVYWMKLLPNSAITFVPCRLICRISVQGSRFSHISVIQFHVQEFFISRFRLRFLCIWLSIYPCYFLSGVSTCPVIIYHAENTILKTLFFLLHFLCCLCILYSFSFVVKARELPMCKGSEGTILKTFKSSYRTGTNFNLEKISLLPLVSANVCQCW